MTHTYSIAGMTCNGCEAKVKSKLLLIPEVLSVDVSNQTHSATIEMSEHISLAKLQEALGGKAATFRIAATHNEFREQTKSWFHIYKPVLLIFGYLLLFTLAAEWLHGGFHETRWMNNFMAGFFIVFSFFKLLNLRGFADNYAAYDVIAKNWKPWGYIYPFIELGLGIAFFTGLYPVFFNVGAVIVMSVSLWGVIQTLYSGKQIQCACLGDVFNLPMSTVTIIEDALMIVMGGLMLVQIL